MRFQAGHACAIGFLLFTGCQASLLAQNKDPDEPRVVLREIKRTENKDGVKLTLARTGKWDGIKLVKSEIKVGEAAGLEIKGAVSPIIKEDDLRKLQNGETIEVEAKVDPLAKALKVAGGFKVENRAQLMLVDIPPPVIVVTKIKKVNATLIMTLKREGTFSPDQPLVRHTTYVQICLDGSGVRVGQPVPLIDEDIAALASNAATRDITFPFTFAVGTKLVASGVFWASEVGGEPIPVPFGSKHTVVEN